MPTAPDCAPLLAHATAAELRQRHATATGLLRRRLDHLVWIARHAHAYAEYRTSTIHVVPEGLVRPLAAPDESAYPFLAWLLTGDAAFAATAKQQLLLVADSVAEREKGDWCQCHCWCDAFPMGRWIALADWLWTSGVLTPAEQAHLQERFLYYLWAHPGQRLAARHLDGTPGNNQNGAMAFACAVGGYLFGRRHATDPTAERLLQQALPHLLSFLTTFPRGGYSFEGSTYMGRVNAFILPLALELATTITGVDLLDSRANADCASPREVLQAIRRLAMPGGLMLPWDNYGYEPAAFAPAAAYLARRTGDGDGLALLEQDGLVGRPCHVGWGHDANLWTLLYYPDALAASPAAYTHATPTLGGGAAGPAQRLYAYQMWDRHHWPPGRAQFNPNNLVVQYDGAPLLLDGRLVEIAKQPAFADPRYLYRRADTGTTANLGSGSVGAHNCLIFNDEDEFAPTASLEGALAGFDQQGDAAVIVGDVTACYVPRYAVHQVTRATLLLGDDLLLVRDRVRAAQEYRVTWRAHLRFGDCETAPAYAALTSPEGCRLELCLPPGQEFVHRPWPTPPGARDGQFETACHELNHHAAGSDLTLHTLLVPTATRAPLQELAGAWEWRYALTADAADALRRAWPGGQPLDPADGAWFYTTGEQRPGYGLYRRTLTLATLPEELWLALPRLVRSAQLYVNDQPFPLVLGWEEEPLLPHQVAIRSALHEGENTILLIIHSTFEAALHGPLRLLAPAPLPPPARLEPAGPDTWRLHHHGTVDEVVWTDDALTLRRADGATLRLDPRRLPPPAADRPGAPVPAAVLAAFLQAAPPPPPPVPEAELVTAIGDPEWRVALAALEAAQRQPSPALVAAALARLADEHAHHRTPYPRASQDDICWYRLKAEAVRLLGCARHAPSVPLLGELFLGGDVYPVRAAAAWALGRIGGPEALTLLRQAPLHDEHNTHLATQEALHRLTR